MIRPNCFLNVFLNYIEQKKAPAAAAAQAPGSAVAPKAGQAIESFFNEIIKSSTIVIFSKTTCPYCAKVKELLRSLKYDFVSVELDRLGKNKKQKNPFTKFNK